MAQKTIVSGKVVDESSKEGIANVKIQFFNSKIGVLSDSMGNYTLETYYATDSLQFSFPGYATVRYKIKLDQTQVLNVKLAVKIANFEEITIRPPDELPSTRLHKKVIAHKKVNNREKLDAYEYELYNKIQLDGNNLGDKFNQIGLVKKLDFVLNYMDTSAEGQTFLPLVLSESVSDFYFTNNPKNKKEVVKATRVTGIENFTISQFLGDMYLEINVYDNIIDLFGKSFISPIANYSRSYYKYFLEDSTYIGTNWCYKLRFIPKRKGDLVFEGEMWIHDTTYAVKQIKANITGLANLNYIQDFYFEQDFKQIEQEVWMLTNEKLIADLRLKQGTKLIGLYARRSSSRKNFVVNTKRPTEFYKSDNTVEIMDGATNKTKEEWSELRHSALNLNEKGIDLMIDSLNKAPLFVKLKKLTYFAATGYFPLGKVELGSVFSLLSSNPVEKYRVSLGLRTSNDFSRRIELGGTLGYGFLDQRWKYGALIRYNVSPKKRALLSGYYNFNIEQIGQSPTAVALGSTFATVFSTAPFDKLTFVKKVGLNFEKDVKKDIVIFTGMEWKQFNPLGVTSYLCYNPSSQIIDTVNQIRTAEITARFRWTKDEEFISGAFDRTSVTSSFPILSIQAIFGVKGIFGSQYNYQKLEFQLEHNTQVGIFGRMKYGASVGYVFGITAYPFLKVHEGNQSLWLQTSTFNKLNFVEFVSDQYVSSFIENHWEGLFFDRIPLVNKLKMRLVTTGRIMYGGVSERHNQVMLMPAFVKKFGNVPYAELSIGIENIFKVLRVDLVWRMTHNTPGISPLGVRANFSFNF
jgi:hypothetical protein